MKQCEDRPVPGTAEGGLDDLNRWLGRREAFSLTAGRCSAADIECMRRIRDHKLYLGRAESWPEFCVEHFHMGERNANRLIGLLEKYGAEYFHTAQITRIFGSEYRAFSPTTGTRGIESNGESIPLTPENSERIAEAVLSLRQARESTREPAHEDSLPEFEAAGNRLLKRFRDLAGRRGRRDPRVAALASSLQSRFEQLLAEIE